MNIGDRIKQRRMELGVDVDELAAKINKSKATLYRYENGDIENMPVTVLEPIAKALETTTDYLMGWDDDSISSNSNNTIISKQLNLFLHKNDMTQLELAKKLGISATSVSNWCTGLKTPRMSKVDAMCKIFNCSRSDLLEDRPYLFSQSTFKNTLKTLRQSNGLSQGELADKLGLSQSTIAMYELGQRHPDFATEELIADYFNVDLNTLHGKCNNTDNTQFTTGEYGTIAKTVALLEILPAEQQLLIYKVAKQFALSNTIHAPAIDDNDN